MNTQEQFEQKVREVTRWAEELITELAPNTCLRCFRCDNEMKPVHSDVPNQPYEGVYFSTLPRRHR